MLPQARAGVMWTAWPRCVRQRNSCLTNRAFSAARDRSPRDTDRMYTVGQIQWRAVYSSDLSISRCSAFPINRHFPCPARAINSLSPFKSNHPGTSSFPTIKLGVPEMPSFRARARFLSMTAFHLGPATSASRRFGSSLTSISSWKFNRER